MAKLKATDPKEAIPSKPKILIFGPAGCGKSWAAITWPSAYYLDVEGGVNLPQYTDRLKASGGVYMGPEHGANDFAIVLEEVMTLATTKHPFRTLVIDSFSKLFNTKIANTAEALEKAGKKNEFAADKKPAVALTRRLVSWLDRLDMNVILICHEKPVWLNGEQVGVTFDGWEKLSYELHLALHIQKQGASRKAKVVKTRLQAFPDSTLFDWSYEEFANRYGKEAIEADVKPAAMATEEQLAQYRSLIEAVKVDQKILDTWDENVPDVKDLDQAGIIKRINFLTSLLPKSKAGAA